jgi:hypothetical protein
MNSPSIPTKMYKIQLITKKLMQKSYFQTLFESWLNVVQIMDFNWIKLKF